MDLLYKPDWEQTKERFKAWWAHEYFGRCAISITSPKDGLPREEPPAPPDKAEDRWFDYDYIRASNEYRLSRTFFGGEAIPVWHPGYPGWGTIGCFLGAKVDLDESTGWVHPFIDKGMLTDYDCREVVIDPENRWWKLQKEMLRFGVEESKGKSLTSIGALGGCGDTLAMIRGSDNLLYDMIDCPEYVREFDQYLMRQWIEVYDTLYNIISETDEGSTCWFQLWTPGRFYPTHNDFAYMISPQSFRDVFLPSIEMQTDYLDRSVHHVDGEGNFAHIDALLELPRPQAFQIAPGAGKPGPLHYMDVLKKVQSAGKNLHIYLRPDEIREALENLSARGLFINTVCETESQARQLLDDCEKWSVDRG